MGQNITRHPFERSPDELVPSRYALKIGDIDVCLRSGSTTPTGTTASNTGDTFRWVPAYWDY